MLYLRSGRRSRQTSRERGATVVEYGLLTALFVLVTVSGIQFLFDSSSTAIQANGVDIAEPRQYADQLVTSTQPAPDDWDGSTVPQGETLYDVTFSMAGECANQGRRTLELGPCTGELDTLYSLELWNGSDYRVTGSNTGRCVIANGRAGATLLQDTCVGAPDEMWEITRVDAQTMVLTSPLTGYCWMADRGRIIEAVCSGLADQHITIDRPPGP